jgi:hypothetical protein
MLPKICEDNRGLRGLLRFSNLFGQRAAPAELIIRKHAAISGLHLLCCGTQSPADSAISSVEARTVHDSRVFIRRSAVQLETTGTFAIACTNRG